MTSLPEVSTAASGPSLSVGAERGRLAAPVPPCRWGPFRRPPPLRRVPLPPALKRPSPAGRSSVLRCYGRGRGAFPPPSPLIGGRSPQTSLNLRNATLSLDAHVVIAGSVCWNVKRPSLCLSVSARTARLVPLVRNTGTYVDTRDPVSRADISPVFRRPPGRVTSRATVRAERASMPAVYAGGLPAPRKGTSPRQRLDRPVWVCGAKPPALPTNSLKQLTSGLR